MAAAVLVIAGGAGGACGAGAASSAGGGVDQRLSSPSSPGAATVLPAEFIFPVENYRSSGDPPGDDTIAVQRACNAAMEVGGAIYPAPRQYNITQVILGQEGQRKKCDIIGGALNLDVEQKSSNGAYFKQIAGTSKSMFIIPSTTP